MRKKIFMLFFICILLCILSVSCRKDDASSDAWDSRTPGNENFDNEKNEKDDESASSEPNDSDAIPSYSVRFRFVDPAGNTLVDLKNGAEQDIICTVKAHTAAQVPHGFVGALQKYENWVIVGWDTDGDDVADEGYKNVTDTMEVTTVCRPKKDCTVTFVKANGDPILNGTLTVKEGEAITDEMILRQFDIPVELGKCFDQWVLHDEYADSDSDITCIADDCTFIPFYTATHGTIPRVHDEIVIDGRKDEAYAKAAYLPLNNLRQDTDCIADTAITSDTVAYAWLVWDGDFVYVLVEVSDKTLCAFDILSSLHTDAAELFYSFEKGAEAINKTHVGMFAQSGPLYSASLLSGVMQGRSTHFGEVEAAALSAFSDEGIFAGLYLNGYDADGNDAPSYRIEFKIPAKTEGEPNRLQYPDIDLTTGFVAGTEQNFASEEAYQQALNDASNYKFTEGETVESGDVLRLSLCVIDTGEHGSHILAQTRRQTAYYVAFTLGDSEESLTTVYGYTADQAFLDEAGNVITP